MTIRRGNLQDADWKPLDSPSLFCTYDAMLSTVQFSWKGEASQVQSLDEVLCRVVEEALLHRDFVTICEKRV